MKKLLVLVAIVCVGISGAQAATAQGLSVETLAVIRHNNIHDGVSYGAGLDIGYKLNTYVTGHIRAVGFEDSNWDGPSVDVGSLLVEAQLLQSANKKLSLSAIGGVNRHFDTEDWGLAAGPRFSYALTKNLSIVAEEQVEMLIRGGKSLTTFAGLKLSF